MLQRASGGVVYWKGKDGAEYKLPCLTMKQIADIGAWWMSQLRERFRANIAAMSLTPGQQVLAMREFEQGEPSLTDVIRFAMTPAGIDRVCAVAKGDDAVDVLGTPLDRCEIANRLLQLAPATDELPDPTPVAEASPATGT
jgi:hypothetical protein